MAKPLYKYRPALIPPEDLKETLVGRKGILERLLKTLKETPKSEGLQHFLLIGPRGAGKTHLLLLIYHIVKGNISWAGISNLNCYWVPVLFGEEEYRITTLAEMLLVGLEKICDETGWADALEIKAQLSKIPILGKEECERILDFLKQKRGEENKRFLLLLDNIQDILPHFTEEDQGRLREVLMSQDILMLIGTAPTIFNAVAQYEKPFYNFFEILWLQEISEEEVEELIKCRLKMDGRGEYLKQFEQVRYRIKAIFHLTGGNPRLVLSLYEIFTEDRMLEVEKSLLNLLDGLTPYFQDRMKDVTVQQRKILDAIALSEGPPTPMEISRMARLPINITISQLTRLKRGGYVRLIREKGKKRVLYDLSDRLFRLWRQMSVEAGRRRLTIIVKFLEVWFSPEEIVNRIEKMIDEIITALTKGERERVEELTQKLYYYLEAAQTYIRYPPRILRIEELIKIDKLREAEVEAEKLFREVKAQKNKELMASVLLLKSVIYYQKGDKESAMDALKECSKLHPRIPAIQKLISLLYLQFNIERTIALLRMGKWGSALKDAEEAYRTAQKLKLEKFKRLCAEQLLAINLILSLENIVKGNMGRASEYFKSALPYLPNISSEAVQEYIGSYLKGLLTFRRVDLLESVLKSLMEEGDENLRQFLKPYEAAIRYYHTKDPFILNRLFPEVRKIVEEIVGKLS